MCKRRFVLVLIGISGLCAGALEYLCARPANSAYLHIYGILGQWVPDFFHTFSFSLITIALFSRTRGSRMEFCLLWFLIDTLFELGQRYSGEIAQYIPAWLNNIPVFENTRNYFIKGTFDMYDIIAISLGAVIAFLVAEMIAKGEIGYITAKKEAGIYA